MACLGIPELPRLAERVEVGIVGSFSVIQKGGSVIAARTYPFGAGATMKRVGRNGRLILLALVVVGIAMTVNGFHPRADSGRPAALCPLCQTEGIPIPARDQLNHCECEKWWVSSPARIAFGDCSKRQCQDGDEEPKLIWIELPLYRCPKDGLLFTDPE